MTGEAFHFQVDLRGMIRVLSESLYTTPRVFVRELLQNASDAIAARTALGQPFAARIRFELTPPSRETPATLTIADTGVGLTEAEVHRFLATIGSSSKRLADGRASQDFIGAFGIGLLSCFMVADEIVVLTQSAKPNEPACEWRGRSDGTYTLRTIATRLEPGTQVILRARADAGEWFEPTTLKDAIQHYGGLLPVPIDLITPGGTSPMNQHTRPWRERFADDAARRKAYLALGREVFEERAIDAIELTGDGIEGLAFVSATAGSAKRQKSHRVYLKGMLLTEDGDGLVPDWAFFVRVLVNTTDLSPAASREAFREDEKLAAAREAITDSLRSYLFDLAESDPAKLRKLVATHLVAIKSLAAADDEALLVFAPVLPFETTQGTLTLTELAARTDQVRYVRSSDEFQQVAAVVTAMDLCVINAGHQFDQELIERFAMRQPSLDIQPVEVADLLHTLQPTTDADAAKFDRLEGVARQALASFRCGVIVRRFEPPELPALYSIDGRERFKRDVERTKSNADALWTDVLGGIEDAMPQGRSQICFNADNPLVAKLASLSLRSGDDGLTRRAIEVLYVQALLLGHHPLAAAEHRILSGGLIDLIDRAANAQGSKS